VSGDAKVRIKTVIGQVEPGAVCVQALGRVMRRSSYWVLALCAKRINLEENFMHGMLDLTLWVKLL
jgi:hypothetical protein